MWLVVEAIRRRSAPESGPRCWSCGEADDGPEETAPAGSETPVPSPVVRPMTRDLGEGPSVLGRLEGRPAMVDRHAGLVDGVRPRGLRKPEGSWEVLLVAAAATTTAEVVVEEVGDPIGPGHTNGTPLTGAYACSKWPPGVEDVPTTAVSLADLEAHTDALVADGNTADAEEMRADSNASPPGNPGVEEEEAWRRRKRSGPGCCNLLESGRGDMPAVVDRE